MTGDRRANLGHRPQTRCGKLPKRRRDLFQTGNASPHNRPGAATGQTQQTAPIRVLVCDDHGLVRSGLRLLLNGDAAIEVIGEAATAEEAIRKTRLEKPDLVLLDLVLPGRSGLDALPEILAVAPQTHVLVLSMQDDPHYVRAAFAAGASGYLLKDAADTELVAAVRQVAAGDQYLHPALGARLASHQSAAAPRAPRVVLSSRERQVLRLLALGHANQEIARELYLSVRTVETHRARIMGKLQLKTRAQLVRYTISTGMLADPDPAAGWNRGN